MRPTFTPRKIMEIDAAYAAVLGAGFPVTLGGNAETLQVARDVDRTNWLTFLGICDEAIAVGAGAVNAPIPLRCTSNREYVVTFAQGAQIVRDLRAWAGAAQGNWWRLKDLARACVNNDALRAMDLSQGWPADG